MFYLFVEKNRNEMLNNNCGLFNVVKARNNVVKKRGIEARSTQECTQFWSH